MRSTYRSRAPLRATSTGLPGHSLVVEQQFVRGFYEPKKQLAAPISPYVNKLDLVATDTLSGQADYVLMQIANADRTCLKGRLTTFESETVIGFDSWVEPPVDMTAQASAICVTGSSLIVKGTAVSLAATSVGGTVTAASVYQASPYSVEVDDLLNSDSNAIALQRVTEGVISILPITQMRVTRPVTTTWPAAQGQRVDSSDAIGKAVLAYDFENVTSPNYWAYAGQFSGGVFFNSRGDVSTTFGTHSIRDSPALMGPVKVSLNFAYSYTATTTAARLRFSYLNSSGVEVVQQNVDITGTEAETTTPGTFVVRFSWTGTVNLEFPVSTINIDVPGVNAAANLTDGFVRFEQADGYNNFDCYNVLSFQDLDTTQTVSLTTTTALTFVPTLAGQATRTPIMRAKTSTETYTMAIESWVLSGAAYNLTAEDYKLMLAAATEIPKIVRAPSIPVESTEATASGLQAIAKGLIAPAANFAVDTAQKLATKGVNVLAGGLDKLFGLSAGSGCLVCGRPDHELPACPVRREALRNAEWNVVAAEPELKQDIVRYRRPVAQRKKAAEVNLLYYEFDSGALAGDQLAWVQKNCATQWNPLRIFCRVAEPIPADLIALSSGDPYGLTVPPSVLRNYPAQYPGDFPPALLLGQAAGFDVLRRIPPQASARAFHRSQMRVGSNPQRARMIINAFPIVLSADASVLPAAFVLSKTEVDCEKKTTASLPYDVALCSNMELQQEFVQTITALMGPEEIYKEFKYVYLIATEEQRSIALSGPSWQLAAALTLRLIPSPWAVTGAVAPGTDAVGQVDHLQLKIAGLRSLGLGLMTNFVMDGQAPPDLHGEVIVPADIELARLRLGELGDLSEPVDIDSLSEAALVAMSARDPAVRSAERKIKDPSLGVGPKGKPQPTASKSLKKREKRLRRQQRRARRKRTERQAEAELEAMESQGVYELYNLDAAAPYLSRKEFDEARARTAKRFENALANASTTAERKAIIRDYFRGYYAFDR